MLMSGFWVGMRGYLAKWLNLSRRRSSARSKDPARACRFGKERPRKKPGDESGPRKRGQNVGEVVIAHRDSRECKESGHGEQSDAPPARKKQGEGERQPEHVRRVT